MLVQMAKFHSLEKTDFKSKIVMRKRAQFIKRITIVNIYAPNIRAPKHIKQTLTDLKGVIDNSMITIGTSIHQF